MQSGFLKRHSPLVVLGQRILDALLAFAMLPLIAYAYGIPYSRPYHVAAICAALLTWVMMEIVDAYRPWRGARLLAEARVVIGGWAMVAITLLVIAWGNMSTQFYSRLVVGWWFLLTPIAMLSMHFAIRAGARVLRRNGRNTRTAILIGAGGLGRELVHRVKDAGWMGVHLLGCFDDDTKKIGGDVLGVPVLGKSMEAVGFVKSRKVDLVYLALPMRAEKRMHEIFDALQDTTASVYMLPDVFVFQLMGARVQDVGGLPVFSLCETPLAGAFGMLKRMEDVLLSCLILMLIWPAMLMIAMGVKMTSPGTVFFRQRRYGLDGREIVVWKFRTMTVCEDGEQVAQAKKNDGRVTCFGAFLRRTSLDELPQFINVLQGRMSIVGPRPHAVVHNEQYRKLIKGYMWRHKVKPGITGWAQVNGWRGETDTLDKMQKRVEFDLEYIRRWSLWLDLKIVLLTIFKGFRGKNAY